VTSPGQPTRTRVSPTSLAIVALGLALLVLSIRQAGVNNITTSVRSVGPWLIAVVALGALRMVVRARAWSLCSRAEHEEGLPFRAAFGAVLAADALGNLTPLGLLASEPTKVVLARRHVPTAVSLSSVAVENGFYTASVLVMLLGGVWVLLQRADVPPLIERMGEGIVAASAFAGVVALWMFRSRPALLSRAGHLLARLIGRPGSAATFDALERSVYDVVHWPATRLVQVAAWEASFHVLAVLEVWLILRVMPGGANTSFQDAFLMETTGRFITVAFKFIPYRLGVDEMGSGSVAQFIGLGASSGVALALVRRIRILVLNLGGIVLLARDRHR
jgi:Lysylphosphatidylglycerol synthase TM region